MGENLDYFYGTSGTSLDPPMTFHIKKIINTIPEVLLTKQIPQGHYRLFLVSPHPHQLKKYKTDITYFILMHFPIDSPVTFNPKEENRKETF